MASKYKHYLYHTWNMMKNRCNNPKSKNYKNYGARGISVCDRWLKDFWNFVDDMGDRPKGHSLDRINNDGNYEPSNCRWATPDQQNRNNRRNIYVSDGVEKLILKDYCKKYDLNYNTITNRIKDHGWSVEKAVSESIGKLETYYLNGEAICVKDEADARGYNYGTIKSRLERGWSVERALNTPPRKRIKNQRGE